MRWLKDLWTRLRGRNNGHAPVEPLPDPHLSSYDERVAAEQRQAALQRRVRVLDRLIEAQTRAGYQPHEKSRSA